MTKENNSIRRLKEAVADIESMIGDNCKHPLYRPLQEIKRYTRTVDTAFSVWLRANPTLDPAVADLCIADMDWVIYQYKRHDDKNGDRRIRNLMFVEEKTFGASVGWQQHELLSVIHQLMPRPKKVQSEPVLSDPPTALDVAVTAFAGLGYALSARALLLLALGGAFILAMKAAVWWDFSQAV